MFYAPEGLQDSARGFNPISANLLEFMSRQMLASTVSEDEDEFEDDYD